jgi:transcriptional regulator with XRE-family HTH domain
MQVSDQTFLNSVLAICAIKRLRHYELADMVGISRSQLSVILRGHQPMTAELQEKITAAINGLGESTDEA